MDGVRYVQDLKIPTLIPTVWILVFVWSFRQRSSADLTDELYESKIVYRTEKFEDMVRTFCMNPQGVVVNENTNGIVTVNGHSYEDPAKQTNNTNFALLVSKHFSEPFQDSQRIWREYCQTFQYAWRRCYGSAFRRSDPRKTKHNKPRIEESFVTTDTFRNTGRFKSGAAETYPGWNHRDDLCAG